MRNCALLRPASGGCARRERPCGRAADWRNQLAPFQLIEPHTGTLVLRRKAD